MELMSVSTISYNNDLNPFSVIHLNSSSGYFCRRCWRNNTVEGRFTAVMPVLLKIQISRDVTLHLSEIIVKRGHSVMTFRDNSPNDNSVTSEEDTNLQTHQAR